MSIIRFIICCLTLLSVVACTRSDPMQQPGVIELSNVFKADFDLVDHNGQPATDERFAGKSLLIYFGFASCPDVCPAALSVMSASMEELGKDAEKIQPLFISVDPERDTPEVLKAHLAFDERILGLTGDLEAVSAALKGMKGLPPKKQLMPDSALEYQVQHLRMFYFVDAQGSPQIALLDSMAPREMAGVLKALVN